MHNQDIDSSRRRAIKLVAYGAMTLPFVGVSGGVIAAEELSTAPEDEASATVTEVSRGHVIEVSNPQASSSEALPEVAADTISQEILLIDGEPIPYYKNEQGYHIYYQPPENSLLKAARNFVETQREK